MLRFANQDIILLLGSFEGYDNASDCVKIMLAKNPARQVEDSLTTTATSVSLEGYFVGKSEITISAQSFSFQPSTVFGTNGNFTLNFTNPLSIIKSMTMETSNITTPYNGEELHIGSVWGDFTGTPSSDEERTIQFVGYSKISILFNPDVIAELLFKK